MDDPVTAARALLLQFQRSRLKACHVVLDGFELFVSRDPAMRASASRPAASPTAAAPEPAPVATHEVTAPHVATLVSLEPVGSAVAQGGVIGRLRLLDEEIAIAAAESGTIVSHAAAGGALVEFGQPLASLAA